MSKRVDQLEIKAKETKEHYVKYANILADVRSNRRLLNENDPSNNLNIHRVGNFTKKLTLAPYLKPSKELKPIDADPQQVTDTSKGNGSDRRQQHKGSDRSRSPLNNKRK